MPGLGVAVAENRWRQMNMKLVRAVEPIGDAFQEIGFRIEPSDLVFVLIRHQLEEGAGDRVGKGCVAWEARSLGFADTIDQGKVTTRVGEVLVLGQEGFSAIDYLIESLGEAMRLGYCCSRGRAGFDEHWIDRGPSPPAKGAPVEFDRHAVQRDSALDRLSRERHQSPLVRVTEHEKIARDRIAEEAGGDTGRVEKLGVLRTSRIGNASPQLAAVEHEIGVAGELAGDGLVAVDDCATVAGLQLRQRIAACRDHEIATQQQARAARGDAHGVDLVGPAGNPDMTVDGAALLGEPGHIEDSAALLFEMRRHSKECAARDDSGAAYTGDEDTVRS